MSVCNDLILLRYGFGHRPSDGSGHTDCFQLVCEVRRRLGLRDYAPDFDWVYQTYTETTLSRYRVIRWMLERCERTLSPSPGDITVLPSRRSGALAVVTDSVGLLYLSESERVVHAQTVSPGLSLFRPQP
jgi:hypothetical protein